MMEKSDWESGHLKWAGVGASDVATENIVYFETIEFESIWLNKMALPSKLAAVAVFYALPQPT